jgi:DNA-directed RNA polymerase specialized sigma24 family protein
MASQSDGIEHPEKLFGQFTTTHWSVVLAAGTHDTPESAAALEQLCRTYWYPLYAYVRRTGCSPQDAEDLVQGFFLYLFNRQVLRSLEREGGRFRSFMLATFKNFVSGQRDMSAAKKRGGGRQFISLELAEHLFERESAGEESADRLFERRWVLALLERAMERLEHECAAAGKNELFSQLKSFVSGEKGLTSYAEAADLASMTPGAVKSAIFRLRRRYYELVREEVGHTVAEPRELKEELRYLLGLFNSG